MSKARNIVIAAGAAAVIAGVGITAANNNSGTNSAITIQMNSSDVSSDISQLESLPDESETAVSVPEDAAEILSVTVEPEKSSSIVTIASTYFPAAETTESVKTPETTAATAPKTTIITTTAPTEPAEAAVTITEKHSQTVYIAASGKGSKYHSNPSCSNMKGANAISIDDAKARGYTACKKCY